MEVRKIITKTEVQNIDITGITLLSIEEYNSYKENIPIFNDFWWLRSPGLDGSMYASIVGGGGSGYGYGISVGFDNSAVRPALQISNLGNFEVGDKFKLVDKTWTIISNDYALCDDSIGKCAFREDWKADDANDYEASDVKKFVEKWYQENILNQ